jgi:hypothetical protein
MSHFVELKTAELTGQALDWAVAKCSEMPLFTMGDEWPGNYSVTMTAAEKPILILDFTGRMWREYQGVTVPWEPSTNWAQGGPLLDKYATMVFSRDSSADVMIGGFWNPSREAACEKKTPNAYGPSILVALCRAIVAANLGSVVQVPAELVGEV